MFYDASKVMQWFICFSSTCIWFQTLSSPSHFCPNLLQINPQRPSPCPLPCYGEEILRDEGQMPFIFWNIYPVTTKFELTDINNNQNRGEPLLFEWCTLAITVGRAYFWLFNWCNESWHCSLIKSGRSFLMAFVNNCSVQDSVIFPIARIIINCLWVLGGNECHTFCLSWSKNWTYPRLKDRP